MGGRTAPLTICAPAGIEEFIDAVCRFTDLQRLNYPLQFIRSDAADFCYDDGEVRVDNIALSHRVPSYAYRFTEQVRDFLLDTERLAALQIARGPAWGELQHGHDVVLADGRRITPQQVCLPMRAARCIVVGGDNDKPALLDAALQHSDVLIHEATFTEDVLARVGPQYQHSTPAQVASTAQRAGIAHLILTHFSQRYRRQRQVGAHALDDLFTEARALYTGNLLMAEDLASYELHKDKTLVPIATR